MRNRQKTETVGNTIVNEAAEGAVASKPSAMGSIGISHGPNADTSRQVQKNKFGTTHMGSSFRYADFPKPGAMMRKQESCNCGVRCRLDLGVW